MTVVTACCLDPTRVVPVSDCPAQSAPTTTSLVLVTCYGTDVTCSRHGGDKCLGTSFLSLYFHHSSPSMPVLEQPVTFAPASRSPSCSLILVRSFPATSVLSLLVNTSFSRSVYAYCLSNPCLLPGAHLPRTIAADSLYCYLRHSRPSRNPIVISRQLNTLRLVEPTVHLTAPLACASCLCPVRYYDSYLSAWCHRSSSLGPTISAPANQWRSLLPPIKHPIAPMPMPHAACSLYLGCSFCSPDCSTTPKSSDFTDLIARQPPFPFAPSFSSLLFLFLPLPLLPFLPSFYIPTSTIIVTFDDFIHSASFAAWRLHLTCLITTLSVSSSISISDPSLPSGCHLSSAICRLIYSTSIITSVALHPVSLLFSLFFDYYSFVSHALPYPTTNTSLGCL